MKTPFAPFFAIGLSLFGSAVAVEAENIGKLEYERSCVQCHGSTGKGDGYLADTLSIAPPDLTAIMSRNDGVFPVSDIYQLIISGTWDGRVHVTNQMPVWGPRYALEAKDNLSSQPGDKTLLVDRGVHQRVGALVNYIHLLQVPAPKSAVVAFSLIENQLTQIFALQPEAVELVVIVPRGYQATRAEAILEWEELGQLHPASGIYEMESFAIRDLVGGQRQTSYVFQARDHAALAGILGNSELIGQLEELSTSGSEQSPPKNRVNINFNFEFCLADQLVAQPSGFPAFHLRDRNTGAKFFDLTIPVAVREFSSGPCS